MQGRDRETETNQIYVQQQRNERLEVRKVQSDLHQLIMSLIVNFPSNCDR